MDTTELVTAEELLAMGSAAERFELVRGRMVPVNPPNGGHGQIAATLAAEIRAFVRPRKLGTVMVESGFTLSRAPDTVRGPDVSFVRLPRAGGVPRKGFISGAPELAVEVRSPEDTRRSMRDKAAEYLAAGSELVWVVEPDAETVTVFTPGVAPRVLRKSDALDGGTTLPGFVLPLSDVFERW